MSTLFTILNMHLVQICWKVLSNLSSLEQCSMGKSYALIYLWIYNRINTYPDQLVYHSMLAISTHVHQNIN